MNRISNFFREISSLSFPLDLNKIINEVLFQVKHWRVFNCQVCRTAILYDSTRSCMLII